MSNLSSKLTGLVSNVQRKVLTFGFESQFWALGIGSIIEDLIFSSKNVVQDLPDKSDEVAVITGGEKGIGYEVIKKLLMCDMHVIMGCTSTEDGQAAMKAIRSEGIETGCVDVLFLDLASLKSVSNFSERVLASTDKINILINNAGIMGIPHMLTRDGFEAQFAVNYLSHFMLTSLLLKKLKQTGCESKNFSRIINVASCAHILGKINFDDFNYMNSTYIPNKAYCQSKLAQLMFSKALERRLRKEGARVCSYAVHPGVVNTALYEETPIHNILPWAPKILFRTPEKGSRAIVYTAISEDLEGEGGFYISNCRKSWVTATANSILMQEKLMYVTLQMLNLNDFGDGGLVDYETCECENSS